MSESFHYWNRTGLGKSALNIKGLPYKAFFSPSFRSSHSLHLILQITEFFLVKSIRLSMVNSFIPQSLWGTLSSEPEPCDPSSIPGGIPQDIWNEISSEVEVSPPPPHPVFYLEISDLSTPSSAVMSPKSPSDKTSLHPRSYVYHGLNPSGITRQLIPPSRCTYPRPGRPLCETWDCPVQARHEAGPCVPEFPLRKRNLPIYPHEVQTAMLRLYLGKKKERIETFLTAFVDVHQMDVLQMDL